MENVEIEKRNANEHRVNDMCVIKVVTSKKILFSSVDKQATP